MRICVCIYTYIYMYVYTHTYNVHTHILIICVINRLIVTVSNRCVLPRTAPDSLYARIPGHQWKKLLDRIGSRIS